MTHLPPRRFTQSRNLEGFTLLELLVSVTIFTIILAALFAVLVALQEADRFRDRNTQVTQSARYAYEPIVRALKAADAEETVFTSAGCRTVRGFYLEDGNQVLTETNLANYDTFSTNTFALKKQQRLVVISAEPTYDTQSGLGPMKEWVRREYELADNDPDPDNPSATPNQTIIEKTYTQRPDLKWPKSISDPKNQNCSPGSELHWGVGPKTTRKLTSSKTNIVKFNVRIASPVRLPKAEKSPFVTLEITTAHGLYSKSEYVGTKKYVPVLTVRSTITPTFSYGVVHE
jgi:prepilin-type N-terminal cleavage/methylation domain-containing protein